MKIFVRLAVIGLYLWVFGIAFVALSARFFTWNH